MGTPQSDRKFYKMADLTTFLGVTPRTVRFYEQSGLLPHVKRSGGNMRLFSDEDVLLIQKILIMQEQESLSLKTIKERLFGATIDQKLWVVTDSEAILPDHTAHVSRVSQDSVAAFEALYRDLSAQGITHIYSIHSSSSASVSYKEACVAADRVSGLVRVDVIDTLSASLGVGVLAFHLSKLIAEGESMDTMELILGKEIPLLQLIFLSEGLSPLVANLQGGKTLPDQIAKGMSALCPVMILNQASLSTVACYLTIDSGADALITLLEEEFALRGKYLGYIVIAYAGLEAQAKRLMTICEDRFPNTLCFVREELDYLTNVIGEKSLAIAIM